MKPKKAEQELKPIKILPWGDKIYLEIPIYRFRNQMMARFGENAEGRRYIEISKFGPLPDGAKQKINTQALGTYSQRLRIYKPSHWGTIKHIIETTLLPAIGWKKEAMQSNVEFSILQKLTKQIKNQSKELDGREKTIAELMNNLSVYRDQNLKNRVPEFKKKLTEFKELIVAKKTENFYQKFLKENFWIFGLEYISVKSQKAGGASNRPDFSMERYDKFRDIAEIKRPQDDVFVQVGSRFHQGSKLKEALAEVMDYVDYFLKHVNDEVVEYDETYYKPKAVIVIGQTKNFKEKIRQLNSFLHRIEIMTYDDLVSRAEKIIEFYEK